MDHHHKVKGAIAAIAADGNRVTKMIVAELNGIYQTTLFHNPALRSLGEAAITGSSVAKSVGASPDKRNHLCNQAPTNLPTSDKSEPGSDGEMVA